MSLEVLGNICSKCHKPINGWVFYKDGNIIDTYNFMIFDNKIICDECLTAQGDNANLNSSIALKNISHYMREIIDKKVNE